MDFGIEGGSGVAYSATLTDAEIETQLTCIQSSPEFDVPDRVWRRSIYVVEEPDAGRDERSKSYSVATKVFGQDAPL
ncbi:hypothetical protein [Ensifer sp. 4252]|uniref:hypothetical protein n=1 Tax=Ensifer sp. 4252 TaxID=3373915 RepID=UPI003D1B1A8E